MSSLEKLNPNCAGIDIGSESIFIGIEDCEVASFGTFTDDYLSAIAHLQRHRITAVAMEATGVYWITLFDMLEQAGITVTLVNGKQVKFLPGRKSDVEDCQWLQQLHSFGLLRPCFIPDELTRELRSYTRLRDDHLSMASSHIQHMHKALTLMNIKVQNVISEIHGASGLRIIRAIIAGERDPERLANLCDKRILNTKREKVIASLKGNFKSQHVFALKQALYLYEVYHTQIAECDKQIETLLKDYTDNLPDPPETTEAKPIRHNAPKIDGLHEMLMKMTGGADPSQITGLTDKTLLELIGETGTKLEEHWQTVKHFTAWLGLAPSMHQSGKSNKHKHLKKNSRAGQIFREGALSISASKQSAHAVFYKRMKAKKGFRFALKATARKLAVIYYHIMTKGIAFVEQGMERYIQKQHEQQKQYIIKKALSLGLIVSPI
jgi:transposase